MYTKRDIQIFNKVIAEQRRKQNVRADHNDMVVTLCIAGLVALFAASVVTVLFLVTIHTLTTGI